MAGLTIKQASTRLPEIDEAPKSVEKWVGTQQGKESLREPPGRFILKFVDYFDLDYELFCNGYKRQPKNKTFVALPPPSALDDMLDKLIEAERSQGKPGRPARRLKLDEPSPSHRTAKK